MILVAIRKIHQLLRSTGRRPSQIYKSELQDAADTTAGPGTRHTREEQNALEKGECRVFHTHLTGHTLENN